MFNCGECSREKYDKAIFEEVEGGVEGTEVAGWDELVDEVPQQVADCNALRGSNNRGGGGGVS